MVKIAKNLTDLIGKTPLMELSNYNKVNNISGRLVAKLEYFNPMGSVKDRVALSMINEAEKKGIINKDTVIIEATSGNTGIGLAFVAAVKGYKLILTMPDTMSVERRNLLKALNAELVLTDGKKGMKGAIKRAEELAVENPNSLIAGQFINPANSKIHKDTTAEEIWEDTDGKIAVFVAGIGTGGTITGVGEALKAKNPDIKIIGFEPDDSAVLSGEKAGAHEIQGIGAGFVPDILNLEIIDEIYRVKNDDAFKTSQSLAKKEGLLVGISSGAAVFVATEIAKRSEFNGKIIVALLPDMGERYLSTSLYEYKDTDSTN